MSTAAAKPIDKLLVANRGEIACRIMRTANSLGMKTVAIYSEPDWAAPHVRMADEAICVGSAASADSYLRIDRIIEAVKVTGAQAVHPGYGFLSENKDFSAAVEEAGASFCGPGAYAIEAMGDKITSKKLAQEAGVDTIPGFNGILSGPDEAVKVANEVRPRRSRAPPCREQAHLPPPLPLRPQASLPAAPALLARRPSPRLPARASPSPPLSSGWLPGDAQGLCRRRRQGHAHRV